jgi:hypothetical protein
LAVTLQVYAHLYEGDLDRLYVGLDATRQADVDPMWTKSRTAPALATR